MKREYFKAIIKGADESKQFKEFKQKEIDSESAAVNEFAYQLGFLQF